MPADAYMQHSCKVRSRFRTMSTKKVVEDNATTAGTRLCLTWHRLVISFLVRRKLVGPAYASCTHRSCFAWFVLRQMIRLEEGETRSPMTSHRKMNAQLANFCVDGTCQILSHRCPPCVVRILFGLPQCLGKTRAGPPFLLDAS